MLASRRRPSWVVKRIFLDLSLWSLACQYLMVASIVNYIVASSKSRYICPFVGLCTITVSSPRSKYNSRREAKVSCHSESTRYSVTPFRLGTFDKTHGEHLIYIMLIEFYCLSPCAVWGWFYWSAIRLLEVDSGMYNLHRIKVSVANALRLCKFVNKLLAICWMFVGYFHINTSAYVQNFVWFYY